MSSEKTKEEQLKLKLEEFFDKRLSTLNEKFTSDIEKIESYKYDYFDSIIKIYREIQEEQSKQEELEKLEKEKEKEKHEKKAEEQKHEKITKKKPGNNNKERPKTPSGINKAKARENKDKEKEKEKHDNTTHETKEKKKPNLNSLNLGNSKSSKLGRINTESNKRPYTSKPDNKKTTGGKKPPVNNKKTDNKKTKGKKDAKNAKEETKEQKDEIKEEAPKIEEKKPVIINPKYIINIPEEIKNNNNLCSIYFTIKKNFLDKKNIFIIAQSTPLLYKSFNNNIKFLLEPKKNDADKNAKEIESFLNNYGDLKTYLTKEFSLSKKAMNSLSMFKKEEISKSDTLPSEMGNILKYLYYLLDEKFDENMSIKELLDNMLTNILEKIEDKSFKTLLLNYFQKNKFLNLTQEKADNINKIVNENNTILNMAVIAKTCRPFNFISFLFKEVHDYINLKTSDGHYYYELRQKNQQLQKYLDFIYLYDNNGKERNKSAEEKPEKQPKLEENKNEAEEKVEKKEEEKKEEKPEENKVEEEKKEEVKNEENKVEEESVKKEESTEPEHNA